MELLRGVHNIIFLVTFFGSTLSVLVSNTGECGSYTSGLYYEIFTEGNNCAEIGATPTTAIELQRAKDVEDYRKFFRGYCQRQSFVRECLSNTTRKFELCRNQTYVTGFNIYRGFLETLLDIECTGEGTRLATFWQGLHSLVSNETELAKIMPCFIRTLGLIEDMGTSNVDIPSLIFIFHKEMQWFKECIHQAPLNGEFKEVVDIFMNEIVNRMKCINPKDGRLEPCATIDASLITKTSACSVKTRNDELTIYDALEDESVRCLYFIFEYDYPPYSDVTGKELLERVCYSEEKLRRCIPKARTFSDMCMNVTQQKELQILGDSIYSAFAIGCADEGSIRLVEIMQEVNRLSPNGDEHGNVVLDCIDEAKSNRNKENVSSSKNMRFYHELEAFKGCLVVKLGGDQTSVVAATSLIDETLGIVKCVSPEDGTTVLCKSIAHKVQDANQG